MKPTEERKAMRMVVGSAEIALFVPWSHSLKEKRMVLRSLMAKVRGRFNVSIAEVADQDLHQRIVLGIACATNEAAMADSILDSVIHYMESVFEGEILSVDREIR